MSPPINQVKRFGKPTWRRLVEAVEDKVGGNNPALAQKIAGDHPSAPGIAISIVVCYQPMQIKCATHMHNLCLWYISQHMDLILFNVLPVHVLHEAVLVDQSLQVMPLSNLSYTCIPYINHSSNILIMLMQLIPNLKCACHD